MMRNMKNPPSRQNGSAAIEFTLVALILFTFVFAAMEVARALYVWSTMAEISNRTARLAAVSDPADAAQVRHKAMFLNNLNKLPLGGEIDETYLRIDYLGTDRTNSISPAPTPIQNLINCTSSPTNAGCVRFVQVRLCMPGTDCTAVPYKPMIALDSLNGFNMTMPTFSTVVAVDTLGLTPAP